MIIGLTGGIASGKSTAAAQLESKGARVMDGDVLGHRAYEPETAFARIARPSARMLSAPTTESIVRS